MQTSLAIAALCFVLTLFTGWWPLLAAAILCAGLFFLFSARSVLDLIFPSKR